MTFWITLCISSFLSSFFLSWAIVKWLGKQLIDIPNDRSSHQQPTPRGGGLAISLTFVLISTYLFIQGSPLVPSIFIIMLVTSMAALGALDDFISLNIQPRLFFQALLATIGIYLCMHNLDAPLPILIITGCLLVLALMWFTNLYNFMDGINGIASIQAIATCFSMSIILILNGSDTWMIAQLTIIGFSCAGFLYWNFPTAKIFMGDSGSLFLGFTFGLISIKTSSSFETAATWLILMAVFISDASFTLFTRLLSGQKFYLPHRSHAYQKIAQKLNSHTQTTLLILAFNLLWLFPLAFLTNIKLLNPIWALTFAYCPLIICSITMKAGRQIN